MLAVVLRLRRAAAAAEDLLADATAESGLTASDALYLDRLVHLGHAGPLSRPVAIRDLAGAMGCAPSTLTTVVRRLERLGYLRRSQTPFDRRTVGIEASRPGEVAVAIFQAAARDLDAELERVLEERPQGEGVLAVVSALCDRLETWSAQERTEAARVGRDVARRLQETSVPRRVGTRAVVDRDAGVVEEGSGEADEALPGDRSDDARKVRGG